jgi:ABC-2 type transport system permease protein
MLSCALASAGWLSREADMFFTLELYRRLISIRIRAQMQYRISFLFDVLTMGFLSGVFFLTLALVLQRFDGIGGWGLGEVAFLYGMVETSFGFMDMLFSGFDPQAFGVQVRQGTFDQLLLRPASITLQVLGSEFVLRRLGRILQGAAILAFAIWITGIDWTIAKLIYLPIVMLSQVCFFGGLFIIGATITFWTIESIEVVNIFTYGGSELMSYPVHIYPIWMVRFFTFVIPAIFLNYYPALYFLGKADPFNLQPWASFAAPLAGFGVLAIGMLFWQYGIRQYQSTGT